MTDDAFKAESPFEDPEIILKQVAESALPGPQPPSDDPAAAILAIDDWQDEWVVIFGNDRPNKLFLSETSQRAHHSRNPHQCHP